MRRFLPRGRLAGRHLAMLVVLALLAVVHLIGEDRVPGLDQVAGLLWVVLAVLVVVSLRSVELAAGKAASQSGGVREVRDVTRRIAGSVGKISQALAGERPPRTAAPVARTAGPVQPAPARPTRPAPPAPPPIPAARELDDDESGLRRLVGRGTAPELASQRNWEPVAEVVAAGLPPRGGVAVVGSPALLRELSAVAAVVPLRPGYALHLVELTQPRFVVLDRAAFVTGPWFGAETTSGLDLAEELHDVAAWAADRHVDLFWVDAPVPAGPATRTLRALAGTHLPLPEEELEPEGAPQTVLLATLQRLSAARLAADGVPA